MVLHLYRRDRKRDTDEDLIETGRITQLSESRVLTIGTAPCARHIPLTDIDWFWIEEN